MENYIGSEEHKENARKASVLARKELKVQKEERIDDYHIHSKTCIYCKKNLLYKQRHNKYCSSSCSASHSQLGKKKNAKTKEAIRKGMKKFISSNEYKPKKEGSNKSCSIHFRTCTGCKNVFVAANSKGNYKRKTCSKACNVEASVRSRTYQNGSRKPVWYDNPWQGKVLLDSSWEVRVADLLCELNIKWLRPESIPWKDKKSRTRYYYADFYLSDYEIYLDPKNEYCMQKDKEKMQAVEQNIKIEYGHVDKILGYIKNL